MDASYTSVYVTKEAFFTGNSRNFFYGINDPVSIAGSGPHKQDSVFRDGITHGPYVRPKGIIMHRGDHGYNVQVVGSFIE
jgi:hypothetical protein